MVELSFFRFGRSNSSRFAADPLVNVVTTNQQKRLVAKDGRINFKRIHIEERQRYIFDIFITLLDMPWLSILFLFLFCFIVSWIIFACIWYLIMKSHGDFEENVLNGTIDHIPCIAGIKSFKGTILYSIETQQTIGYGTRAVTENCSIGIFVLIIQSCFGLLIQAIWVGLVYTKLSRPRKRRRTLIWSKYAIICLRDGHLTLQCRLADMRYRSTLVEAHIRMYFISRRRTLENEVIPLNLLDMNVGYDKGRDRVFFNWPIIIEHRIDRYSPLYHMDKQQIQNEKFEILLVLEGTIEPTGMITQVKTSYMPQEIIWGVRFQRMISFDQQHYTVDYSKLNSTYADNLTPEISAQQIDQQQQNH